MCWPLELINLLVDGKDPIAEKFIFVRMTHKKIYGDKQTWPKYLYIQICCNTCFGGPGLFCAAAVISLILTLHLYHCSFFSLTPLHSYDDTAFTSIHAAYLAISKAGIMPLNYTSYIWEIRSEPRHYNPSIRNLSNLHRLCADFSISAIWILLRVRKERAVYMQDLVFERQNSELY